MNEWMESMNQWINRCNESMNEWINAWINEWMNGWMHEWNEMKWKEITWHEMKWNVVIFVLLLPLISSPRWFLFEIWIKTLTDLVQVVYLQRLTVDMSGSGFSLGEMKTRWWCLYCDGPKKSYFHIQRRKSDGSCMDLQPQYTHIYIDI